jgi:hypothetical protein
MAVNFNIRVSNYWTFALNIVNFKYVFNGPRIEFFTILVFEIFKSFELIVFSIYCWQLYDTHNSHATQIRLMICIDIKNFMHEKINRL